MNEFLNFMVFIIVVTQGTFFSPQIDTGQLTFKKMIHVSKNCIPVNMYEYCIEIACQELK